MPLVLIREDPVLHVCQPPRQVVTQTHTHTQPKLLIIRMLWITYNNPIGKISTIDIQIDVLWFGVLEKNWGGPFMTSNLSFGVDGYLGKNQMCGQEFNSTLAIEHTRLKMLNTT